MIVNTASKCGLTPQYEGLEDLYKTYKDDNFVIIGFPLIIFYGKNLDPMIKLNHFVERIMGNFSMMSKISVKGSSMHPIYKFLTSKERNGVSSSSVSWNFQKYLINEEGVLEKVISPRTKPKDPQIVDWIKSS